MDERRLTRLGSDGWELESAEERHARAPATFWIPSPAARRNVQPGHAVKLLFRIAGEHGPGTERMWVVVTDGDGAWYRGRLQNEPVADVDLGPGSVVWFRAEHVADITSPPEDYRPI